MNVKTYIRCRKCIMDTTDPLITFNDDGICNYCTTIVPQKMKLHYANQPEELRELINNLKILGTGKEYDAVMGISGGVDSSYTAYMAKELGLRVHLLTIDNGYDTKEAKHNARAVAEYTGFPLEERMVNLVDYIGVQLAYLSSGVINLEAPTDHFIRAAVLRFAQEKGTEFWLTGSNYETESIIPRAWGSSNTDVINIKNILKAHGFNHKEMDLPFMGIWAYKRITRKILRIPLLNYLPYNRSKAKKILMDHCGWQDYGKKHCENIYTRFYQCYILPRRYNYDKRLSHLSSMINAGQLTRSQALSELHEEIYPEDELRADMDYINNKLGVHDDFWLDYIQRPDVPHSKYGNDRLHLYLATAFFEPWKIPRKGIRILRKILRV